jgi:hypothetical protein
MAPSNPLVTLTGGGFSDAAGNVLASGFLLFYLSHDEQNTFLPSQVVSGLSVKINLDNNGNVVAGSQIYANDQLSPTGSFYTVEAYTNDGRRAWSYPQYITVTTGSGSFSLSGIFPTNPPGAGGSGSSGIVLETNGTVNGNQALLNIAAGTNITATNSGGTVTISATGGTTFEQNGTPLTSSSTVNFESGSGITVSNPSAGNVLVTNSAPGGLFSGTGAFFVGPGITDVSLVFGAPYWNATIPSNEANATYTANQVVVYIFQLFATFTISKASQVASNNVGGVHATFGIYTEAGAKVLDAGAFLASTGAGVQTNNVNGGTPVTLPPGVYYHAQAATTTNTGMTFLGVQPNSTNPVAMFLTNFPNRAAIAANALSSGILPATLGTLTSFTPSHANNDGICAPLYE